MPIDYTRKGPKRPPKISYVKDTRSSAVLTPALARAPEAPTPLGNPMDVGWAGRSTGEFEAGALGAPVLEPAPSVSRPPPRELALDLADAIGGTTPGGGLEVAVNERGSTRLRGMTRLDAFVRTAPGGSFVIHVRIPHRLSVVHDGWTVAQIAVTPTSRTEVTLNTEQVRKARAREGSVKHALNQAFERLGLKAPFTGETSEFG